MQRNVSDEERSSVAPNTDYGDGTPEARPTTDMTNETRTQFVAFLEYFSTTQDIVPGTQASSGGSQGDHLSEPHYPNTYVYTLEGPGSSPVEVRTNDGALSYLPITEEAHHDVPITPSAPSSTAGNIIKDSTVGIPYAVSSVAFFAPLASGDSVVGVDALLGRLGEIDKSVKGEWASAVGREDRAAISILYVDPTPTGGFARASTCAEFACEILIEKLPDHADFFKNNLLVRTLMLIGFLEGSRNKGETLVQEQWEAWQNTRPPALAGAASVIPRTEEATRSIRRQAKARYVNFLARLLFVIASTEFRKRVSDSFTGDAVVLIRYILNVIDLLESKLDALFQAEEGSDVEAESLQEDP